VLGEAEVNPDLDKPKLFEITVLQLSIVAGCHCPAPAAGSFVIYWYFFRSRRAATVNSQE